uniref:Uncharacterized protein n=1 Tax=Meleagris gallopavo TaxID=9103 RepID=A0A803YM96_MELGA
MEIAAFNATRNNLKKGVFLEVERVQSCFYLKEVTVWHTNFIWFDTKCLINAKLTHIVSSGYRVPLRKHHRVTARVLGYQKRVCQLHMLLKLWFSSLAFVTAVVFQGHFVYHSSISLGKNYRKL